MNICLINEIYINIQYMRFIVTKKSIIFLVYCINRLNIFLESEFDSNLFYAYNEHREISLIELYCINIKTEYI